MNYAVTVTLTGAAGSGKTRLADAMVEAATDLGFAVDINREGVVEPITYPAVKDADRVLIVETEA